METEKEIAQKVMGRILGKDIVRMRKTYNYLTALNEHTSAAKMLVENFGTDEERAEIYAIAARQQNQGYLTQEDSRKRFEISNKYYALIR